MDSFNWGIVYGLCIAFVLGSLLGKILDKWQTVKAAYRPLNTFPLPSQAKLTAGKINCRSSCALVAILFWLVVLGGVGYVVAKYTPQIRAFLESL